MKPAWMTRGEGAASGGGLGAGLLVQPSQPSQPAGPGVVRQFPLPVPPRDPIVPRAWPRWDVEARLKANLDGSCHGLVIVCKDDTAFDQLRRHKQHHTTAAALKQAMVRANITPCFIYLERGDKGRAELLGVFVVTRVSLSDSIIEIERVLYVPPLNGTTLRGALPGVFDAAQPVLDKFSVRNLVRALCDECRRHETRAARQRLPPSSAPLPPPLPPLADKLAHHEVRTLLRGKRVLVIGDSIMRGLYKDLVYLLQQDHELEMAHLKKKGEASFSNDTLIRRSSEKSNAPDFEEERQGYVAKTDTWVRYAYATRAMNHNVRDALTRFFEAAFAADQADQAAAHQASAAPRAAAEPEPPREPNTNTIVLMNSALWDLTRYNKPNGHNTPNETEEDAIGAYVGNLESIGHGLAALRHRGVAALWCAAMPVAPSNSSELLGQPGGVNLEAKQRYQQDLLARNVPRANALAQHVMARYGVGYFDSWSMGIPFLPVRLDDGVHWYALGRIPPPPYARTRDTK